VIEQDRHFQPKTAQVAASIIDGETVIVHLSNGNYYSMDGSGSSVWALIEQKRSPAEIAALLAGQYSVDASQVSGDVQALFEKMIAEGIIEDADTPPEGAAPALPADASGYQAPELRAYRDMRDLLALDPPMPGLRDIPWKNPDSKA